MRYPALLVTIALTLSGASVLLVSAPAAWAQAGAPRASKSKEMAARKAFGAGDWGRALELYSDLYAETLHPIYLRNIARCHQRLRNPQKAIDLFQEYLSKYKPDAKERMEIDGYIKEMEALKQEQAPGPAPAPAALPPAAPVPVAQSHVDLTAQPAPPAAPVYTRWWFWTAVGGAVAAGVVTAFLVTQKATPTRECPSGVVCM
jgi:hypothetical protein